MHTIIVSLISAKNTLKGHTWIQISVWMLQQESGCFSSFFLPNRGSTSEQGQILFASGLCEEWRYYLQCAKDINMLTHQCCLYNVRYKNRLHMYYSGCFSQNTLKIMTCKQHTTHMGLTTSNPRTTNMSACTHAIPTLFSMIIFPILHMWSAHCIHNIINQYAHIQLNNTHCTSIPKLHGSPWLLYVLLKIIYSKIRINNTPKTNTHTSQIHSSLMLSLMDDSA